MKTLGGMTVIIVLVILLSLIAFVANYTDFFAELTIKPLSKIFVPRYPNNNFWGIESVQHSEGELGPIRTYGGMIDFTTDDNAEKVIAYYKSKLSSGGWRIVDEINGQQGLYRVKLRKEIFNLYSLSITVIACDSIQASDFTKIRNSRLIPEQAVFNLLRGCNHKSIEIGG